MGAGASRARNTINNTTKASVITNMGSEVNALTNTECKNLQEVSNVQGCTITFAPQTCTAAVTSLVTTNTTLDSSVTQSIFNDVKQSAEASNEGLIIGIQVSDTSNVVQNLSDIAIKTNQTFKTDCTKNTSGINTQVIEDSTCTEKNEIQFATQDISMEVYAECTATQVGTSTASQTVANIMDQAAKASNKGLDLWTIIVLGILGLAFLLVGPIGFRIMTAARTKASPPENKVALFMIVVVVLCVLGWNVLAGYFLGFGLFPYRPIQRNSEGELIALCRNGESIDQDVAINKFMWWDADCITYPEDESCNDDRRQRHYAECGLFANNGCDDPEFTTARDQYITMNKTCAKLNNEGFPVYCRPADVAAQWFANSYRGCIRCSDPEGDNASLFGTFIADSKIDPDNESDDAPRMTCDLSNLDPLAYLATGGNACEAGDEVPYCYSTLEDLLNVSPYDCPNTAYQARKQWYSKGVRDCEDILANTLATPPADGTPIPLDEICPPNVFDYFTKCSAGTKECTYIASGCVDCDADGENCDCSAADPYVVASCKNDLTDCKDPEYLTDYNVWKAWDDRCKANWDQWNALNPAATTYSVVFYAISLVIVLILFFVGGRRIAAKDGFYENADTKTFSWFKKKDGPPVATPA